ncbi:spidroin-2-like [Gadus macrocephalus]|uniref:spidroin-2-like n=1 Tax=Gadus macrocephalus TaxID=80720 RepID=UPI0028CB24D9|nr:spidroin-2-like [Gadus macrocephalus]
MGCCFSKELLPGPRSGERTGLLSAPRPDSLTPVTERDRAPCSALAQHVCLASEWSHAGEKRPPGGGKGETGPKEQEKEKGPPLRGTLGKGGRGGVGGPAVLEVLTAGGQEQGRQRAPAHADEVGAGPHVGPPGQAPPPLKQKVKDNAAVRASWFRRLPEGPGGQRGPGGWGPAGTAATPVGGGGADPVVAAATPLPPLVSAWREKRPAPEEEEEEEEEEECIVTATLGQGFVARTQSFYSICSISAEDLGHEAEGPRGPGPRAADESTAAPPDIAPAAAASTRR